VKQARRNVSTPKGRAHGITQLEVFVDTHERYPYRFAQQAVRTVRRTLAAGDYAVELDGDIVAAVERKGLDDLTNSLMSGRLRFALAELAALPRAAVVIEERFSSLLKVEYVRPSVAVDALAEVQVRWPSVPIVFCETRPLAEEWTYRFLAAALNQLTLERDASAIEFTEAEPLSPLA
jgi:ERCC4-type nuclease